MAHGNFSDVVALIFFATGILFMAVPQEILTFSIGDVKGFLNPTTVFSTELLIMVRTLGSLIILVAIILSVIVWDDYNGKMTGLGFLIHAGFVSYQTYVNYDHNVFVPRPQYGFAVISVLTALWMFTRGCACEKCRGKKKTKKN